MSGPTTRINYMPHSVPFPTLSLLITHPQSFLAYQRFSEPSAYLHLLAERKKIPVLCAESTFVFGVWVFFFQEIYVEPHQGFGRRIWECSFSSCETLICGMWCASLSGNDGFQIRIFFSTAASSHAPIMQSVWYAGWLILHDKRPGVGLIICTFKESHLCCWDAATFSPLSLILFVN